MVDRWKKPGVGSAPQIWKMHIIIILLWISFKQNCALAPKNNGLSPLKRKKEEDILNVYTKVQTNFKKVKFVSKNVIKGIIYYGDNINI